ncbi:MAG: hypothetical protein ACOX89_03305 [Lutispora sp.]|jgi:hypothetical protein
MNHNAVKNALLTFIAALVILCTTGNTIFAENMVLGIIPDGIYPVAQKNISLVSEEVTVNLTGDELATVSCRYDFKNHGEAQTVIMAVPARINEKPSGATKEEYLNINSFAVFYEKIEEVVPVKMVDSIPNGPMKESNGNEPKYSKWYTFSIDFEKGEELSIYVMYVVNLPYDNMHNMFFGFMMESGALWQGPINHAKVIFDTGWYPIYTVTEISPSDLFRVEDNKLVWERSNFEPDYDLKLTQNNYTYSDNRLYLLSKNEAKNRDEINAIKEQIALFELSPETIIENREKYYDEYDEALKDNPIKAIYLKSVLGISSDNSDAETPYAQEDDALVSSGDTSENVISQENDINSSSSETVEAKQTSPKGADSMNLVLIGSSLVIVLCLFIVYFFIKGKRKG